MITLLYNEYTFTNIFSVCIYLVLPLIIFFINTSLLGNDKKIKFQDNLLGLICMFFLGMAFIMLGDYFYRISTHEDMGMFKIMFFKPCGEPKLHFYFLGAMLTIFLVTFPVLSWSTSTVTPGIFLITSAVLTAATMLLYSKSISYILALLLLPLGAWQVYMGIKYIKA